MLRHVHPLVSLEDVSPLEASTYVCGAVNPMFQLRTRKYDIMAVVAGGKLLRQRAAEVRMLLPPRQQWQSPLRPC